MYFAFSSALRSADLSRQVGAVVTRHNQILATGANDCPRSGGGLYWPQRNKNDSIISDEPKGRDHMRGYDSNKKQQQQIIDAIIDRGSEEPYNFCKEKLNNLLEKSGISDLTEYGRVVHAEMEALLSCGRIGISTLEAELYCTTFPCHNCAKHIIAAGVRRVVYIEPYAKSKALEFHDEAIRMGANGDSNQQKEGKVVFEPFVGIGPRRFFDLFSMSLGSSYELKRKDDKTGEKAVWSIQKARLRVQMKPVSYLDLEQDASTQFLKLKNAQGAT